MSFFFFVFSFLSTRELTAWIQAKYVEQRFRPTPKTAAEWARFEAEDARLLFSSPSSSSSSSSAAAIRPSATVRGLPAATPARRLHTLPSRIKSCDDGASASLSAAFRPIGDELWPSTTSASAEAMPAEAETAATPRRRSSAKLTKRDIERGWDSIQSEWRVGETDREELVKLQQLERKRMIDEAKQRKKAKGRLERRSVTMLSFTSPFSSSSSSSSPFSSASSSSSSSSSSSPSSLSSSSSYSSAPSTSSEQNKKKSEGRMKRLSRDLTALFSSSTDALLGRKGSSAGENEQRKHVARRRSVSVSSSSSSSASASASALSSAPVIMVGGSMKIPPAKPSDDGEEETITLFRQRKTTRKSERRAKSEDDTGKTEKNEKEKTTVKGKSASEKGKQLRGQASPRGKDFIEKPSREAADEKKKKKVEVREKKEKSPKMKAKTAKPSGDGAPPITEDTHHRSTKRRL